MKMETYSAEFYKSKLDSQRERVSVQAALRALPSEFPSLALGPAGSAGSEVAAPAAAAEAVRGANRFRVAAKAAEASARLQAARALG